MIRWFMQIAIRHFAGVLLLGAIALVAAACNDALVDEDSARVIKRAVDTLVQRDTTRFYDTLVVSDTLYSVDTVVRYDTVIKERTIIRVDTLFKTDTLKLRDTITVRDTVVRYDTIPDDRREFMIEGWIYTRSATSYEMVDSLPLYADPASQLKLELNAQNAPAWMELRLSARVPAPSYAVPWERRASAFIYLLVSIPNMPGAGASADRNLAFDPRYESPGIAVIPHPPAKPFWFATGISGNTGTFRVDRVEAASRTIHTSFKAQFSAPDLFAIDSAAMTIRY